MTDIRYFNALHAAETAFLSRMGQGPYGAEHRAEHACFPDGRIAFILAGLNYLQALRKAKASGRSEDLTASFEACARKDKAVARLRHACPGSGPCVDVGAILREILAAQKAA